MKLEKLHSHYGPGGRNCVCCGPAPGERKQFDRMVNRRVRRFFKDMIKQQLSELKDSENG